MKKQGKKKGEASPIALRMRLDVWDKEVILTLDQASYVAVAKSYGEVVDDGAALGRTLYIEGTRKPCIIGWFNGKLDTLVHECVHAAVAVLDDKGVPLKLECDEALAYTVDCLFAALRKGRRGK